MILIHVMRHWGDPATWTTPIGTVVSFLGGPPPAPVFMFLMGASVAFSRRTSFRSLASRGVLLVAAGYLLNLVRGTLPLSAGLATGVVTPDEVAPFTPLSLLWMVDILQLAGCSLILMAALREVVPVGPAWLLIALVVVLVAPVLDGLATGIVVVDALLGMLWATADNVYYPVLPWSVFPLVGAVVGDAMVRARDRRTVLRRTGVVALIGCVVGVVLITATSTTLDDRTYLAPPPVLVPAILGFVIAWVWLCDIVVHHAGRRFGLPVVYGWGARVTSMYVIHWLIVAWGVAIVGFRVMGLDPCWSRWSLSSRQRSSLRAGGHGCAGSSRWRKHRRSDRPRSRPGPDEDKEEPRVVGAGVQGVGGLVAGRGFEPLTFGL